MGGSSKQVTGHKYFATFVGMIGNCIEGIWGWNFDNRGWIRHPRGELIKAGKFNIDRQDLYGETEGGISGYVDIKDGDPNQTSNDIYAAYLAQNDLPPVAYRYLSYLVYEDFYWGNNPYMKEVLIWPKRIHKKFDGGGQWYDEKAEIPENGSNPGGGGEGDEPLDIPDGLTISRHLFANDAVQISEPEVGEVRSKTLMFFGGGWSISSSLDLKASSFTSKAVLPYSKWVGSIGVKAGRSGVSIDITGASFSHVDEHGFSIYGIEFIGEIFNININISQTNSIYWTYLNLKRYAAPDAPIYTGDMNPIHKIREILTDYVALNKPESDIDDENFKRAADRIYAEGLGISYAIQEAKCIDVLNDLCSHIEGAVRINRQTGKYQVVLFRDDWFDLEQAHSFDEKSIKTFEAEITNADGPVNVLNINYYDRANIKNSSFNLADVGSIHTVGGEISQTVDFPYYMKRRNAEIVGNWKLKQLSSGAWKGTFTTGKYDARKINRYDVIKISFAKRGIFDLPVRVMNIKLGNGRDNTVSIDFVEVITYSGQSFTAITVDPPVENALSPQPTQPVVFEMPYFEAIQQFGQSQVDLELSNNPELGYLAAAAPKPQNNSLNALLYTDGATGIYTDFERVSSLSYCQALYLDQSIDYLDTSFAVKDIDFVEQRNTPKFVNTDADTIIQMNDELMAFVSYDTETKIITVKRGVLDTVPHKHTSGSLVFWGESIAYDSTQYVQSEVVQAQVLTTTPSSVERLNTTNVISLEMNGRAIRPYPPANVKVNGKFWPIYFEGDFSLTWVNRNRSQQTGGEIIGWFDNGVTLEAGVTCQLILTEFDENDIELVTQNVNVTAVNTFTLAASSMNTNTRKIKIVLKTIRDGFECLYPFEHTILFSNLTAPSNVDFEVIEV